ncbi:Protein of unknown function [Amphibacillus marinus]|uniref:DUF2568 domain-containing protein n=1 Tax=Amphibacillus marinus TaxID=872970 RepID=A0A1H8PQX1_9BACI|nr:YrdB family protein [Amphibacillus marinus]SEO44325.1 Protein of unknown function [Amphibacillus marinus]
MEIVRNLNNGIRFLLEVISVLAIGYWGFHYKEIGYWRIILGISTPLIVILVWSRWGAPMSDHRLDGFAKLALELGVFGFAIVCLSFSQQSKLAIALAIVVVLNTVLVYLL